MVGAQVHRFRDKVAIYIGTGATVYLDPKDARQISKAINKVARSCERESFAQSSGNTHSFDFPKGETGS